MLQLDVDMNLFHRITNEHKAIYSHRREKAREGRHMQPGAGI